MPKGKEVLIRINGMQISEDPADILPVELITPGRYYYKNGSHYLIYDETMEGFDKPVHNLLKFRPSYLEVQKKGLINAQMIIEKAKKTKNVYNTPIGSIELGISTKNVEVKEENNGVSLMADYALDINSAYIGDCTISLRTAPKKEKLDLN